MTPEQVDAIVALVLAWQATQRALPTPMGSEELRVGLAHAKTAHRALLAWHPAAPALPPDDQLRARIAFWRREYSAFGHLSGETLSEMDAAAALPPMEADTMPTIEVGDVLVFADNVTLLIGDHSASHWNNVVYANQTIAAIIRGPVIWRWPSPQEPT